MFLSNKIFTFLDNLIFNALDVYPYILLFKLKHLFRFNLSKNRIIGLISI